LEDGVIESIHWVPAATPPDADAAVLIVDAEDVREGWWDGEVWRDVTAVEVLGVTFWASMPKGPTC
jgi:hypothetical protein